MNFKNSINNKEMKITFQLEEYKKLPFKYYKLYIIYNN